MEYEYLTVEEVLDEIDAYCKKQGNDFLAVAARKEYKVYGALPLTAIKQSLGLEKVTMYRRKKSTS